MVTSELLFIVFYQFPTFNLFDISSLKIILVIYTSAERRQFVGLLKWALRPDSDTYWIGNFLQAIGTCLSQVSQLKKGSPGSMGIKQDSTCRHSRKSRHTDRTASIKSDHPNLWFSGFCFHASSFSSCLSILWYLLLSLISKVC